MFFVKATHFRLFFAHIDLEKAIKWRKISLSKLISGWIKCIKVGNNRLFSNIQPKKEDGKSI